MFWHCLAGRISFYRGCGIIGVSSDYPIISPPKSKTRLLSEVPQPHHCVRSDLAWGGTPTCHQGREGLLCRKAVLQASRWSTVHQKSSLDGTLLPVLPGPTGPTKQQKALFKGRMEDDSSCSGSHVWTVLDYFISLCLCLSSFTGQKDAMSPTCCTIVWFSW